VREEFSGAGFRGNEVEKRRRQKDYRGKYDKQTQLLTGGGGKGVGNRKKQMANREERRWKKKRGKQGLDKED